MGTGNQAVTSASVAVVIPCFNEARRLNRQAFADYLGASQRVILMFVDDGSRDGTLNILRDVCSAHPGKTLLIALPMNVGKAEAIRHGFQRAFSLGFDRVGYWDADLATPLLVIDQFNELLDRNASAEAVIGARVKLLGHYIQRRSLRHYVGRVFSTLASWVLGIGVYDTQCGSKVFKNTASLRAVFAQPFQSRWIFDVEIFSRFIRVYAPSGRRRVEATTIEYPLSYWVHVEGSKVRWNDVFPVAWQLARIWWLLRDSPRSP